MNVLGTRRLFSFFVFAALSFLFLLIHFAHSLTLYKSQYMTGWFLFAAILFLAMYNLRKKFPFLPLGSSSAWLQIHLSIGWLALVLFALHVEFRIPNGRFEAALAVLYLTVAVSGVFGLWISRTFPPRLSRHGEVAPVAGFAERRKLGEEVFFEQIPILRRQLRETAESLVLSSAEGSTSPSIADFYTDRLHAYFGSSKNFWRHIIGSSYALSALLREFIVLRRYLDDKDRAVLDRLEDLVRAKDTLDYFYALQAVLRGWLFIHIPLTYGLLLFAVFHGVLVYAFSSANP